MEYERVVKVPSTQAEGVEGEGEGVDEGVVDGEVVEDGVGVVVGVELVDGTANGEEYESISEASLNEERVGG